jgi:FixJ family two-component response regulator
MMDKDRRVVPKVSNSPVIAIVDDDESVRAALCRLARSLGFLSCPFESAEDFLHSPRLRDTACLIADVQMPGMSGLELQDALLLAGHRIPIIFITAHPEQRARERAQAGGAVAFFEKPFNVRDIAQSLHSAVGQ